MSLAPSARAHATGHLRRRTTRPAALRKDAVEALRAAAVRFGPGTAAAKAAALATCAGAALSDARALVAYHDALLFLEAHPSDATLLARTRAELARVGTAALRLAEHGPARSRALRDSGLPGSEVTAVLTHAIAAWLARRHPDRAEISGFDAAGASLADTLALCLPKVEAEMLAASGDALALLDEARGGAASRLAWLLATLQQARASDAVTAHLYDALQPCVTVRPGRSALSRTRARAPVATPYLHAEPLVRHPADPVATIRAPLPPPVPLTAAGRMRLIETARAALTMLARETDPVTWPSPGGVALYELGRGAAVALYPMHPSRRFALDSHTGYLMLRNGVPVGYGGAWPFLATARTGANIFAPFRGGESSWLFAQVLRAYRQHYGIKRFVIEPYQFGAGNREGLQSGAFWFYWRLGFRPVEPAVARLARTAFAALEKRRERPPLATLRAFTACDLALDLEPSTPAERCEPAELSFAVSTWIASVHAGDREAAIRDAVARTTSALGVAGFAGWPAAEREAFRSLCLVVGLIPDLSRWTPAERAACVATLRAKGADDDAAYFRGLLAHPRLTAALARVAARPRP